MRLDTLLKVIYYPFWLLFMQASIDSVPRFYFSLTFFNRNGSKTREKLKNGKRIKDRSNPERNNRKEREKQGILEKISTRQKKKQKNIL